MPAPGRQRYATFTVEFLLDETGKTRRSRVAYVQSGDTDTWAGWEPGRLISFLARHAGVRDSPPLSQGAALKPPTRRVKLAPPPSPPAAPKAEMPQPEIQPPESFVPVADTPALTTIEALLAQSSSPEADLAADGIREQRTGAPHLGGVLHLSDLAAALDPAAAAQKNLRHGQAFIVRLRLDFRDVTAPIDLPLHYHAIVNAKGFGKTPSQLVGEEEGTVTRTDPLTLSISGVLLPRGLYRLEAVVRVQSKPAMPEAPQGLMAYHDGGLLHIY